MAAGTIAVIIPINGKFQYLESLLQKLKSQTYPPTEIIVVDNSSEDPGEIPPGLKYFKNYDVPSISGNYNRGAENASSEFLLLTQQDCYPETSHAISELMAALPGTAVAATSRITLPAEVFESYNFWGKVMMAKWL